MTSVGWPECLEHSELHVLHAEQQSRWPTLTREYFGSHFPGLTAPDVPLQAKRHVRHKALCLTFPLHWLIHLFLIESSPIFSGLSIYLITSDA
ncbi:hypothetical protein OH77DRAFT_607693 [Trametes cingulata]|nr:hypothetical protein OH77DRAFT_607693 [Trametes cingulata]